MIEPMSDQRLEEIRAGAERRPRREYGQTKVDELLAELDRQQKVIEAARAVVESSVLKSYNTKRWVDVSDWRSVRSLRSALLALEGKPPEEPSHAH